MSLFDETWEYEDGKLIGRGANKAVIDCPNGLIAPEHLDAVMGPMNFARDDKDSSPAAAVYLDLPNRKHENRLMVPILFRPRGTHYETLRRLVKRWEDGPDFFLGFDPI